MNSVLEKWKDRGTIHREAEACRYHRNIRDRRITEAGRHRDPHITKDTMDIGHPHFTVLKNHFIMITQTRGRKMVVIMRAIGSTGENLRGMVTGKVDQERQSIPEIEIEVDITEVETGIGTITDLEESVQEVVHGGKEDQKIEKRVIEIGHIATMIGTVWIVNVALTEL
jgi:hypothetical protein